MSKREKNDFDDDEEDWGTFLHHRNRPQKKDRGERKEFSHRDGDFGDSRKKRKVRRTSDEAL